VADEISFTIAYDGPALARGRMPLLELAPAMSATAHLVEDGIRLLYGADRSLKIEVNADFRRGSFSFDLFASPDLHHAAQGLIGALTPEHIETGLKLLGLSEDGGLLGFIKWLRNRKIEKVETHGAQSVVTVRDGNNITNNITINAQVVNLARNQTIRKDADGVVAPLRAPGINEFRAEIPGAPATVLEKDDVEYFLPPPVEERELQDRITEEFLEVVGPSFREGNKWKFSQGGDSSFYAAVLDEEFLRQVALHEMTFGKGDLLRVKLRLRVTQTEEGLAPLREVVKVLEKISPPKQKEMFESDEE
jgi:hypothetical protein